jgi:hypothetical protein
MKSLFAALFLLAATTLPLQASHCNNDRVDSSNATEETRTD